jgi:putative ABC transport system permease protein
MKWLRQLLVRRRQFDELSEEIREHINEKTAELIAEGMSAEEAAAAAQREFGNVTLVKEYSREEWRWTVVENFLTDVRYALRTLRKSPGFTIVVILTLALGIGANTTVFTVVNGVLLRPLPFPDPDRLFLVSFTTQGGPFDSGPSLADHHYLEFREQDRMFDHVASFASTRANLTGAGDPIQIPVADVTTEFFDVLQSNPEIGRGFLVGEDVPGNDNVVVLGNGIWKDRFASDPQILGKIVQLDGVARIVVGVMPAGFNFPYHAEAWTPLGVRIDPKNSFSRPVVGRLKAGASRQQAQAELETFAGRAPLQPGENRSRMAAQIIPLKELVVGNARESLLVFAGAVAFVLLIACANVANLFLARAAHRRKEIGLRSALGASRWRLVRQLLAESTIVSLAGGAAGILLVFWGMPALIALAPEGRIPRVEMIRVDGYVLAFTLGISVLTAIAFGLAPALQGTRGDMRESLNEGVRGMTRRHEGVRSALAISEIALALVLLAGAGLMVKSFMRLRAVNPGFEPANVMIMTVDLPDSTYRTAAQMRAFHSRTLGELARLPGVRATGAVNWTPLGQFLVRGDFQVQGGPPLPPGYSVDKPCVSAGYFGAMGIRLVHGRDFLESDNESAPGVAIVSQSVARALWPDQDPLGKRISMEDQPKPEDWLSVVGVVEDLKQQGLAREADPAVYQPYLQVRRPFFLSHMSFVVKNGVTLGTLAPAMRSILREVDRDQPVQSIASMDAVVAATMAEPRFHARLLGTFAILALALAVVGTYGVLAYSVAHRTREIGVRIALGAQQANVFTMLLRSALIMAGAGIVIGGAGALAITRVLTNLLFEVKPNDPQIFVLVALTLATAAVLACYIPARRAMRVDPTVALRHG